MKTFKFMLALMIASLFGLSSPALSNAHDELTEEQIGKYKEDGSYDERQARIETLKQSRMSEGSRQRAIYKVRRAELEASGLSPAEAAAALTSGPAMAFPFTAQPELKSTGTVKTLTLLIDFKDILASSDLPGLTVDTIRNNIYGNGTAVAQNFKPHESLHEYYRRASQDKVNVQGNVLGWHHFPKDRSKYEPEKAPASLPPQARRQQQARNDNKAIFKMLSEALDAVDATHDFAQYDNDNDGDIDLVTIMYAGDDTGWGSFWWAYRWEFFTSEAATKKFDGKRAKQFVFQFVDTRGAGGTDYDPTTLLHEMGHAFGLADYYDYDDDVGPEGGVGGLDMMHANKGNQNAFSRWLLDWIKPAVMGSGSPAVKTLQASGSTTNTNKAIAIFPGLNNASAPNGQLFIVENRQRIGNDARLPGDGLLIWHIDASLNDDEDDFANDNSYTDRKLIKLMRADNAHDFTRSESANAATYFTHGKKFTPSSVPNSHDYEGNDTRIVLDQISNSGETMTVKVGFQPTTPMPSPTAPMPAAPGESEPVVNEADLTLESVIKSGEPVSLDTLEALDRKLSVATADDLAGTWKKLEYSNMSKENVDAGSAALKLLLTRWASKDGAQSVNAILELPSDDRVRRESLPLMMHAWANNKPADAAKWYLEKDMSGEVWSNSAAHKSSFTHEAFEGLYMDDPTQALNALEKLKSTSEIFAAVDGIIHANYHSDENPDELVEKLLNSKSEVVKARIKVIQAIRAAEESIKDPKQRLEFRKKMLHSHE